MTLKIKSYNINVILIHNLQNMTLIINVWAKYNKLTILEELESVKDLRSWLAIRRVLCECECLNKTEIRLWALINWSIKSCGCIKRWVTRIWKEPTKGTLKNRKLKQNLEDFIFYTNMYFNNWIFSAERRSAKNKLLNLIKNER